jgi:hypothetical protein
MGRDMCVTCLFEDHDISLLSTKLVALRINYSTEIAYHKQSIQTQSNKSNNWKVFVWQFRFIDMLWQGRYGKRSWFGRYESESLVGRDQYDLRENWTRQSIIDEVFMLY